MKNVLVLSQKGGVGKTTLADELAFAFARDGTPFAFYETDEQGDAIHETTEPSDADVAVIDTPGVLTDDTPDMVRDASAVIIPTRASAHDMPALNRTREMVATYAPGVPVLIVLNGWNRWTNARQYSEWLESDLRPTESVAVLSQSEMVPRAAAAGVSVVAFAPRSRVAQDLAEIELRVRAALGMESADGSQNNG